MTLQNIYFLQKERLGSYIDNLKDQNLIVNIDLMNSAQPLLNSGLLLLFLFQLGLKSDLLPVAKK